MTDLAWLDATGSAELVRAGEITAVELVDAAIARIEKLDGELNAVIHRQFERARAEAAGPLPDGPFAGVPFLLKDAVQHFAGDPEHFGMRVLRDADHHATTDTWLALRFRAAGFVTLGRTNVPEMALMITTEPLAHGATRNPWDRTRSTAGSSGGSAAAVASGMVAAAHGNDMGGSIRAPAANCGLVGFKTSRGRSAGSGLGWLALSVQGPLARTVADAALFLDAMGGASGSDLWHSPPTAPDAFRMAARTPPPGKLRIGRMVSPPTVGVDVHPDCLAALDRAVAALEASGHEVVDVPEIPPSPEVRDAVKVVLSAGLGLTANLVVAPEQRELLMPYTQWLIENNTHTASELTQAQGVLAVAGTLFAELVRGYDLLLTPTTTAPPLPTAELRLDDAAESFAAMGRWSAFTPGANIAGLPAVSLPVHETADGVPLGVQLIGQRYSDDLLMSLSAQLEQHFAWQDRHPPFWTG